MNRPNRWSAAVSSCKRHADAADYGADDLASGNLRIENTAGGDRIHHPGDTNDADLFVDLDLGEYRRMGEVAYLLFSSGSALASFSMRSTLPARIASAGD